MRRIIAIVTMLVTAVSVGSESRAIARGGTLDRPGRSMPVTGPGDDAKPDPTVNDLNATLTKLQEQFVSGWHINAHTKLFFRGDAEQISAALEKLAAVEEAALNVRLSTERGTANRPFPGSGPDSQPCQWSVEHNAWGANPRALTIVIYLGDGSVEVDKLTLPTIRGRAISDAAQ